MFFYCLPVEFIRYYSLVILLFVRSKSDALTSKQLTGLVPSEAEHLKGGCHWRTQRWWSPPIPKRVMLWSQELKCEWGCGVVTCGANTIGINSSHHPLFSPTFLFRCSAAPSEVTKPRGWTGEPSPRNYTGPVALEVSVSDNCKDWRDFKEDRDETEFKKQLDLFKESRRDDSIS